jgi:quercetin dioxygenase-like cupin family protein
LALTRPTGWAVPTICQGQKRNGDASPLHTIYLVLDGELTVATDNGGATLHAMDAVYLAPNERREVRNDTDRVATMLVIMPYTS